MFSVTVCVLCVPEKAKLVWESCVFEWGLYGEAPWCALFSREDLQVIDEYREVGHSVYNLKVLNF